MGLNSFILLRVKPLSSSATLVERDDFGRSEKRDEPLCYNIIVVNIIY